jgi:hypothetical protein
MFTRSPSQFSPLSVEDTQGLPYVAYPMHLAQDTGSVADFCSLTNDKSVPLKTIHLEKDLPRIANFTKVILPAPHHSIYSLNELV